MRTNLEGLLVSYTTPENEDMPPAMGCDEFDYPDDDEGEENLHSPEFHGVYDV